MKNKIINIILSLVIALSFFACEKPEDNIQPPSPRDALWIYSDMVEYSKYVELMTGENSPNRTTQWDMGGTDLGFPIYNSINNKMYYAFGDSFSDPGQTSRWRSNTLAISEDYDFSDGITINDYYKGATGIAKAVIDGHHTLTYGYEVTKIPTGGIEVNGNIYLFYMSIRQWDGWIVNYNGVVKSSDNGLSWERLYDLTWAVTDGITEIGDNVGIDPNRYLNGEYALSSQTVAADTLLLANQTINLSDRNYTEVDYISLEGRAAPNFGQIFPVDGKDGYIYILGIPGGRGRGTKLGRVLKADIEKFEEYEYFIGKNDNNEPQFIKGREGLAAIFDNEDSFIIPQPCGELSVMYNNYLNKWMFVNSIGQGLNFRLADNLWDRWSTEQTILYSDDLQPINIGVTYGGQIHEKLTEEDGRTFYIILSQWMPTYNSSVIKVRLK